jgi:hypothetical protein
MTGLVKKLSSRKSKGIVQWIPLVPEIEHIKLLATKTAFLARTFYQPFSR